MNAKDFRTQFLWLNSILIKTTTQTNKKTGLSIYTLYVSDL